VRLVGFTFLVGLGLVIGLCGCKQPEPPIVMEEEKPDYNKPLPPGELALVKLTDPAQFPDFSGGYAHRRGLEEAATYSLDYLHRPSSQQFFP